jgi:hypothetical protein
MPASHAFSLSITMEVMDRLSALFLATTTAIMRSRARNFYYFGIFTVEVVAMRQVAGSSQCLCLAPCAGFARFSDSHFVG